MQLVGDRSIVARLEPPQKRARLDRALDVRIALVGLGSDVLEQLLHLFEEILVRELARAQVVLGVALRLAGIVVAGALVERPAEKLVVALGPVGANQAFERFEIALVAFVLPYLAHREKLALRLAQNTHEHVGRMHRAHRVEQVASLVGADVGLHLLIV